MEELCSITCIFNLVLKVPENLMFEIIENNDILSNIGISAPPETEAGKIRTVYRD